MYSNFGSTGYFSFRVIPAVSELQLATFSLGQHGDCIPAQQRNQSKNQSCHVPALEPALGQTGCPWQGWFPSPAVSWKAKWLWGREKGGQSSCLKKKRNLPSLCRRSAKLSSREVAQLPFPELVQLMRWPSLKPHSVLHCISLLRRML